MLGSTENYPHTMIVKVGDATEYHLRHPEKNSDTNISRVAKVPFCDVLIPSVSQTSSHDSTISR